MSFPFRVSILILGTLLLGACGDKPTPSTPPAGTPADSVKLAVVNFAPRETPAGVPFNVQRDGNSGISFELNRLPPPTEFKAWFDNKPLTGVVSSKTIVTATIPGDYLAEPGTYPIELEVAGARLPAGDFVVGPR